VPFALHGDVEDRDRFVALLESQAERILVDMPAGSISRLLDMGRALDLFNLFRSCGYSATYFYLIGPQADTMRGIANLCSADAEAKHVAVLNLWGHRKRSDFVLWDGSESDGLKPARAAAMVTAHALLPAIEERSAAIYALRNAPIGAQVDGVPLADRSRATVWRRDADNVISQLRSELRF
jgi:hypothetical protein